MTARAFLGAEIRRARENVGLSRRELAEAFPVSESLVAKWEVGKRVPTPEYVDQLLALLHLPEMARRMMSELVDSEVTPDWLGKWREIESKATAINVFEVIVIPGLLQTADYARALLSASNPGSDEIDAMVRSRIERQTVFDKEDPPTFVSVVDEAAIRRPVGGLRVMRDQLMHISEMIERSYIDIHVVPNDAGEYAGQAGGAFAIAVFDGHELAYEDAALNGDVVESPATIVRFKRLWEAIRSEALPRKASMNLITKVAEQWTI